jgi:hypothetical protein
MKHEHWVPLSRQSVYNLIKKFETTGSVLDKKMTGRRKSKTNYTSALNVLQCIQKSPEKSTRKISQECGMAQRSVIRILKNCKLRPYKERQLQELLSNDPDRRLQFCGWYLDQVDVWQTVFTDEAIFHLNGWFTKKLYWATENPRKFVASRTLHSPKVMVWAGIFQAHLIGPYFFDSNVTGKHIFCIIYCLRNIISQNVARKCNSRYQGNTSEQVELCVVPT